MSVCSQVGWLSVNNERTGIVSLCVGSDMASLIGPWIGAIGSPLLEGK
jgi:hypothetical protein